MKENKLPIIETILKAFQSFLETEKNLSPNSQRMYICDIKIIASHVHENNTYEISKFIEKSSHKKHFKRIKTSVKTFVSFLEKKYNYTLTIEIPHIADSSTKPTTFVTAKPCKIHTLKSVKSLKTERNIYASCIISMIYFEHIRPALLQKICKDDIFLDQNVIVIRKEQNLKIPIIAQHTKTLLEKVLKIHSEKQTPFNCPLFCNIQMNPISTRHMYNLSHNQKVLESLNTKTSCHNFFISGLNHSIEEGLVETLYKKHIPQHAVRRLKSTYNNNNA